MNILITGAGGFIGSHLMDALPEAVGFDNFLTGSRENNVRVMDRDLLDRDEIYPLANHVKPEVVIHCAASYSDPDLWHRDTDTNVAGCINAALIARYHEAHLIYFQTILPPVSSYAISKLAGEQYLRLAEIPLTVFRLANIYGPRNISGPIPVFYKRLRDGQPCTVVDTTRDMVFIDDLVECVLLSIEKGMWGTYDVCSGHQTPIVELYDEVARALEKSGWAGIRVPDNDDVQGTVDPAKGVPGWQPRTSLSVGIDRTVRSYLKSGIGETHTHLRLKA